jgi:hypothetical protein
MLGGLVVGFAIAFVFVLLGASEIYAQIVFGVALAGAVCGCFYADLGFGIFESAVHLIIGFLHGLAERIPEPSALSPRWLTAILAIGAALGLVVGGFRYW